MREEKENDIKERPPDIATPPCSSSFFFYDNQKKDNDTRWDRKRTDERENRKELKPKEIFYIAGRRERECRERSGFWAHLLRRRQSN